MPAEAAVHGGAIARLVRAAAGVAAGALAAAGAPAQTLYKSVAPDGVVLYSASWCGY